MKRATIALAACAIALVLIVVFTRHRGPEGDLDPVAATAPAPAPSQGWVYGRITTLDGATREGRLRWGAGGEEAFWGDYFNGSKHENPWLSHVPPEHRPKERRSIGFLGLKLATKERPLDVRRPFMARFGDIARLDAHGKQVRVTLKNGTSHDLDRFEASDFDDDVRVWDGRGGVEDIGSLRIRSIAFLPAPPMDAVPSRLHGTVRTRQGEFTGFIAWDLDGRVGTDELAGRTAEGELRLRFDVIRSISRPSPNTTLVTLLDGRDHLLIGEGEAAPGSRGIYVDDGRYGRVLISSEILERVDFSQGGSGPAYGDFPPGGPLEGSVTTRSGGRLAGRLVFDLDESETTETLDAPLQGVNYTIVFDTIASIVPVDPEERGADHARVRLRSGDELKLRRTGDLGDANAGILVFVEGRQNPEYVAWSDVERVDFDGGPATPSRLR